MNEGRKAATIPWDLINYTNKRILYLYELLVIFVIADKAHNSQNKANW